MDNTKDNQEGDSVQKTTVTIGHKEVNPIDFFSKNESFVFVYKKTEKLATALYMVTNLLGDAEPMKWTLRTRVAHLLSFTIGFKDILSAREDEFAHDAKAQILEIVSLLEIASRAGLVSDMNFSILKAEFMHLANFLSDFKKIPYHHGDLQHNFFESSRQISQNTHAQNPEKIQTDQRVRHGNVLNIPKRTNRQHIIINLLKKKKEITINDVSQVISDCSEKTIQRELISLIELGIVKKTGERRWSKYYLVEGE